MLRPLDELKKQVSLHGASTLSTPLAKYDKRITSDFLLKAGAEDHTFDRKSFRIEPTKLAETLVAFANADGGTIAIGDQGAQISNHSSVAHPPTQ